VGILDHIFGSRTRSRLRPPVGAEVQERLARYVEEARAGQWTADVMPLASLEPILAASPRDQIETLHLAFAFWQEHRESLRSESGGEPYDPAAHWISHRVAELAARLLRRSLPLTPDDLVSLLEQAVDPANALPVRGVLRAIERHLDGAPSVGVLRDALERAAHTLRSLPGADALDLVERVTALLSGATADVAGVEIEAVDGWTHRLLEIFAEQPDVESLS